MPATRVARARVGLIAVTAAVALAGIYALPASRDVPKRTSLTNSPVEKAPGALTDEESGLRPLELGSDEEPTATTSTTSASQFGGGPTAPPVTSTPGVPDEPDYPHTTQPPVVPDPLLKEFSIPIHGANPFAIAAGANQSVWFTMQNASAIGRVSATGKVTLFPLGEESATTLAITRGADGAMWFTYRDHALVGRITDDGALTEYYVPFSMGARSIAALDDALLLSGSPSWVIRVALNGESSIVGWDSPHPDYLGDIFVDRDKRIWLGGPWLQEMTLVEHVASYSVAVTGGAIVGSGAYAMVQRSDGSIWFSSQSWANEPTPQIVRWLDGEFTRFDVPDGEHPSDLTIGSDGNIWFTQPADDRVGRMTPTGKFRFFDVSKPEGITAGPGGDIWFTEGWNTSMHTDNGNRIGRIDLAQL